MGSLPSHSYLTFILTCQEEKEDERDRCKARKDQNRLLIQASGKEKAEDVNENFIYLELIFEAETERASGPSRREVIPGVM